MGIWFERLGIEGEEDGYGDAGPERVLKIRKKQNM